MLLEDLIISKSIYYLTPSSVPVFNLLILKEQKWLSINYSFSAFAYT
jgi:hypothetical protein